MPGQDICVKISGEAGQGINIAAQALAKAFTRKGLYVFLLTDNPNSIKLEPAWCSLRISEERILSQSHEVDILVVLNRDSLLRRQQEVNIGGFILYDQEAVKLEDKDKRAEAGYISIPFDRLLKELNAPPLLRNTVAIGAVLGLIDYDIKVMEAMLEEQFSRKGEQVVRQNNGALNAGFSYLKENFKPGFNKKLKANTPAGRMFLTGNEAFCCGALKAGCKFIAAYPMTPSSAILHYLAAKEQGYGIVVKQAEDEIAGMNMAVGAGFAGARAMTCTSGGGFALMSEALGMAAQSETPVVAVMGQRPGPSTGQPTHTSQADLRFVIHASQGEFPRIVIAPGDAEECFREGFNAFNLAEKFQLPVIVLTDKYLVESYSSWEGFSLAGLNIERGKLLNQAELDKVSDYKRYAFSEDGISPRALPGMKGGIHVATSYEHDEYGFYQEDPAGVVKAADKRFAKLKLIEAALPQPKIYGPDDAEITLIAWGSSKGPVLEAMKMLAQAKKRVNFLHLVYIWPFPGEAVRQAIQKAKVTLGIEGNKSGQMFGLIREHTGTKLTHSLLKYDGQPFYPIDIYNKVKELF
ncbi:MAG: 2-oxoacid:acceptor oxidoreductase subunit alpha [Candidatus Omnitrophota bacterium]